MVEAVPLATVSFEAITEADAAERFAKEPPSLDAAPRLVAAIEHVLAPIIQSAPDGAAAVARRGRYLVEFSAQGKAAIESGAVQFLQRTDGRLQATLVNEAQQFSENAVLVEGAARSIARAAAVAHVVVLLAVQAQLVTMERSLERIERKLDGVRKRLDDEKVADVRGRLRAMGKLRDELAISDWNSEDKLRWQVALDQADTEFHQVEELARLQCEDATGAIRVAPMNATWFGGSGSALVATVREHVGQFEHHYELLLLCLLGRFVVAHLRKGFRAQVASDDLQRDVDHALAEADRHERLVADRAMEFTTKLKFAAFEVKTRRSLRDDAGEFSARARATIGALRDQLRQLGAETPSPVRALVDVGPGGNLRDVRLLV
jgi:hypothetical protein